MIHKSRYTSLIKERAQQLGFSWCGIARAEKLDDDARRLEHWLHKGYHGKMQYMENYFDLRIDPSKLVPGAKSVIVVLLNYFPKEEQDPNSPRISKYAYGRDYHEVIKDKLNTLASALRAAAGEIHIRGFVDSAPVLERSWAQRSGLGWIGKNGNFITRQQGSFLFIATLITDLELEYDDLFAKDYCGTCSKCIDACPTDAILDNKVIDGSKCVSYFTIELKDLLLPNEMKGKFEEWMFGCDICQDVCPWNRFSKPTTEPGFQPIPEILNFTEQEWEEITDDTFKELFRHSPLKRTKLAGLKRNLRFLRNIE